MNRAEEKHSEFEEDTDNNIISVTNLTKCYSIYKTELDRLKDTLGFFKARKSSFVALDNISFSIRRGEQIGILGRNGAGKSTLLQILSGVLTPTSGKVHVSGSVASLLELGAGFNPELSGRENASFLLKVHNFPLKTIKKKMQEIEEFADIGEFFDHPMKLYSSGMFVRVAFAANTLADPDILIVDEALAVGDSRFQKKCLDHMARLKDCGVTVILVTHDVFTAKTFCSRLLLLNEGRLIDDGDPARVASQYYELLFPSLSSNESSRINLNESIQDRSSGDQMNESEESMPLPALIEGEEPCLFGPELITMTVSGKDLRQSWGAGGAKATSMRIHQLRVPNILLQNTPLKIDLDFEFDAQHLQKISRENDLDMNLIFSLRLDSSKGIAIFDLIESTRRLSIDPLAHKTASISICCTMPFLGSGHYFLTPAISIGEPHRLVPLWSSDNAAMLMIESEEIVFGLIKPIFSVERTA